jgi:hypothetical protein
MKITYRQLKQIIREQVEMAMKEDDQSVYMPLASEEVQAAVKTLNTADPLAKEWAKKNLKL